MEKAKKRERTLFHLGIFSVCLAVVSTPLLALVTLEGLYWLTAALATVDAYAIYGIPLYFGARFRAECDVKCLLAVSERGIADVPEIAESTGLTERAVAARLGKCLERGWLAVCDSADPAAAKYMLNE